MPRQTRTVERRSPAREPARESDPPETRRSWTGAAHEIELAVPASSRPSIGSEGGPSAITLDRTTPARIEQAIAPIAGLVCVGGIGGGFDSPARGLYPRLARALVDARVTTLQVRLREPGALETSIADVLAGVDFLVGAAIERIGIVGHSFGGAVAIAAAVRHQKVRTVVAIAPQSHGAPAHALDDRSLLLVHGEDDEILPPACSCQIRTRVRRGGRCEFDLVAGAGHALDETAEIVFQRVRRWIVDELSVVDVRSHTASSPASPAIRPGVPARSLSRA
jgi:dienelactone hydrolase